MDRATIDERLDRLVNMRNSLDQVMDTLPVKVPGAVRETVKELLFKNEELNQLIQDIVDRRPPRFIVIGKTGVGKSSLINAMIGRYLAKTSAVDIGTTSVASYQYRDGDQTLFDVIDTRGLNESEGARDSAEQALKKAMQQFEPDAIILVMDATDRAGMDEELKQVQLLKPFISQYVPIVCVLTHADHIDPARIKEPERYPEVKEERIKNKRAQVKQLIRDLKLSIDDVIPVSSYIEWSHDAPETLTTIEQKYLTIDFDGRYQIDELLDYLEATIDFQSAIHLMLSTRIERAIKLLTRRIIKVFSGVASTVALTPIPVSDMSVLVPLQLLMVSFIAYVSGRTVDKKMLRDFLISIGGVGSLGYSFKLLAQQGSKLLNVVLPGSGSVISSAIAYSGTFAMGKAAEAYFVDQVSKKDLSDIMKKAEQQARTAFENKN
ncbi:hypothetical protein GCM10012290_17970 [Halolactibacillus alkaliphilus]|uniref:G domain-containing protein n=1 Tax=Halolactibacillus alkaliphilus TaxID=442899 RepID=A0A511X2H5_9BACI|nr:GTPase [Halolactibacillus alkaliphilus]GEN57152.1 hypothetical protein HAL01_16160 [Halolactibacillus alkaliphilus]GGN72193.1 hypothetical protein GCM10012290_17970 [Halolactibacillus alkaliphilus]SFO88367.1 Uncharacterized conserved protein, DUF697 family [Halolactibacillus alkaliphilus]